MTDFTHLHVHTHYSLLDGLPRIDRLLTCAKEQNMSSVAMTDHGVLYGAIDFYQQAKEAGIKPIIGMEAYIARNGRKKKRPRIDTSPYHLVLLARNHQGYRNLIELTSKAHLEGFYYKPRIDYELLEKYSEGLIALSACVQGHIPQEIIAGRQENAEKIAKKYERIFGQGNFFLEIQHHPSIDKQEIANKGVIELAKSCNLPLIATNDVHYLQSDDDKIQDILVCLQTQKKVNDTDRMTMVGDNFALRSTEEMTELFKDVPEAISNSIAIADRCNLEIELGKIRLPYYEVPKAKDPDVYLRELCIKGIVNRYGQNKVDDPEILERLDFELSVIKKTGYATYFLIVQDFVNFAKNQGIIVGPGRGSAAGSLVSYVTNITDIDPLKYDLLFERFLNPERVSMPDIDLDFADTRRDEVLDYVAQKYGQDHVAQIITFGTMAARAAVRDVGRALDYPYDYCDKLAKMIPMFTNLDDALKKVTELQELYNKDPQAKKILDAAKKLEGVARHASTHACGVVITKRQLTNYLPLQISTQDENAVITQYPWQNVEALGLLKMDFLGLKNLTIIEKTLNIVKKTRHEEIDISEIDLEDKETFKLFQKGHTTGVFQLESSGMKRYLKLLKPTEFEDIIAMVSLYRPGPMEWIPDYVNGKHGRKQVNYIHPKLKPILEKTYGVAIYQEQVMKIAQDLAGFTLGEADILRKAMGKKIKSLLMKQKEKFLAGCQANNISQDVATKVFDFIEPFAGYGFTRSHAACYAMIG
ncbi:DNA polymerase III subunit alpha, partial [Patescibacteria group bacterium]|nr:DNA polymerase III subunit alpha [Patescibacteria group bacterium]